MRLTWRRTKPIIPIGCESLSDPIWKQRIKMLSDLLISPMLLKDIQDLAYKTYRWPAHLTTQTIAAGEGTHFYYSSSGFELRQKPTEKGLWYLRMAKQESADDMAPA